jgi:hypothetical protein
MPWYQFLADMVLLAHLAFIAFALLGGLLLLRWPRLIWMHLPAMMWAVFVEVTAWVCPLTPLENYFRALAGGSAYQEDFIGRYLLSLLYPAGLTPAIQLVLAGVVIVLNAVIYTLFIRVRKRKYRVGRESSR